MPKVVVAEICLAFSSPTQTQTPVCVSQKKNRLILVTALWSLGIFAPLRELTLREYFTQHRNLSACLSFGWFPMSSSLESHVLWEDRTNSNYEFKKLERNRNLGLYCSCKMHRRRGFVSIFSEIDNRIGNRRTFSNQYFETIYLSSLNRNQIYTSVG